MLPTLPQFQIQDTEAQQRFQKPGGTRKQSCLVRIFPPAVSGGMLPLTGERVTFGRDATCTIEISDDYISRLHAVIEVECEDYVIHDCGSLNGTFVNDEPVRVQALKPGDQIRMGSHIYKFLSADHVEALYHEAVYQMMTVDALTQAQNRRYFEDAFHREVVRSQRHGRSLALLVFDIDHFKAINDKFGHVVGDEVLKQLCARIRSRVRGDEIFARVGGEEFAIVLVEISRRDAERYAEKLRQLICNSALSTLAGPISVTVSVGLAHTTGLEPITATELFARADNKMYDAKASGRNCLKV